MNWSLFRLSNINKYNQQLCCHHTFRKSSILQHINSFKTLFTVLSYFIASIQVQVAKNQNTNATDINATCNDSRGYVNVFALEL